jgi:hypothetical protein
LSAAFDTYVAHVYVTPSIVGLVFGDVPDRCGTRGVVVVSPGLLTIDSAVPGIEPVVAVHANSFFVPLQSTMLASEPRSVLDIPSWIAS